MAELRLLLLVLVYFVQNLASGKAAITVKMFCTRNTAKTEITAEYRVSVPGSDTYYMTVGYDKANDKLVDDCKIDTVKSGIYTKSVTFSNLGNTVPTISDTKCGSTYVKTSNSPKTIEWSVYVRQTKDFRIVDDQRYTGTCTENDLDKVVTLTGTKMVLNTAVTKLTETTSAELYLIDAKTLQPLGSTVSYSSTQEFYAVVTYYYTSGTSGTYPSGSFPIAVQVVKYEITPGVDFSHSSKRMLLDSNGCSYTGTGSVKTTDPFYTEPFVDFSTPIVSKTKSGFVTFQTKSSKHKVATFSVNPATNVVSFRVELLFCYVNTKDECYDTKKHCNTISGRRKRESSTEFNTTTSMTASFMFNLENTNPDSSEAKSTDAEECFQTNVFWIIIAILGLMLLLCLLFGIYMFSRVKRERNLREEPHFNKGKINPAF